MSEPPRSIAVVDVGATNAKVVQFAPDLSMLAERSQPVRSIDGGAYPALDVGSVVQFMRQALRELDGQMPVDAIVPCTHGSALVLIGEDGAPALPAMSYSADMPDEIASAYRAIAPAFEEVLCAVAPQALTLGRQLLWQQTAFPEAFAGVRHALPYAQYLAYALSGVVASEVTAFGAQSQLWNPRRRTYSGLAEQQEWTRLFPPMRHAGDVLGVAVGLSLRGHARVYCGVHDSNANLQLYRSADPFVLLSTGTWIIAFDTGASLDRLDGARDQVSNTVVDGQAVACARFPGGAEFATLTEEAADAQPNDVDLQSLVERRTYALPSFTSIGGPVPDVGGQGRIIGPAPVGASARVTLASLYCAQMIALALDQLGQTQSVVADGPFAGNSVFSSVLAALLPDRHITLSSEQQGTAKGAARLALPAGLDPPATKLDNVMACGAGGLATYHQGWLQQVLPGRHA